MKQELPPSPMFCLDCCLGTCEHLCSWGGPNEEFRGLLARCGCNLSTREVEVGGLFVSLRPAWATYQDPASKQTTEIKRTLI
jgi:hypothetical protein